MDIVEKKQLQATHPDYDLTKIKKMELLHTGGSEIINNANLFFLKETPTELETIYKLRCQHATYKNYFADIINSYVSELFAKQFAISGSDNPYYADFFGNATRDRESLEIILKQLVVSAMIHGKSYVQIDVPTAFPKNQYEAEQLIRPYLVHIPNISLIDWNKNSDGRYDYAVIESEYTIKQSIFHNRKTIQRYTVWSMQSELAICNKYDIIEDEPILVESITTSFNYIPIIEFELPSELHIGALIGESCIEHYRRYSSLIFAQNRNLFPIPVYAQGAELPANGTLNSLTDNPNRGNEDMKRIAAKGFIVTADTDKIYFAEPKGEIYSNISKQLNELVDDIRSITHIMAKGIKGISAVESGIAKAIDNHEKEIVLTSYGEVIRSFLINLYNELAQIRNEDIEWKILGFEDYRLMLDRKELLEQLLQINNIDIPSKTFKQAMLIQLALQYVDVSAEEQKQIIEEISNNLNDSSENNREDKT